MGEQVVIRFEEQWYVMERIPIEDVADWRARLGLRPMGPVRIEGEDVAWPPMILYEQDRPVGDETQILVGP